VAPVSIRYIVDDVDAAIDSYCDHLGFRELMHPALTFAMLTRAISALVFSAPGGVTGRAPRILEGSTGSPRMGGSLTARSGHR
jgi:catechol 2,3-dioxygenase-like lactoylglutathione lyase family enzyme